MRYDFAASLEALHLLGEPPVIKIDQVTFRVSFDNKIEVMHAGHVRYIRGDYRPSVVTPRARDTE